jgi:broad specificity phosphatase PhoE
MPVICLVRHGQASFGALDYDVLSDIGREQALVAGAELARRGLRDPVTCCGTLNRQRDTAKLLSGAAGFDGRLHEDPRWNEYDHLGLVQRYTGHTADHRVDSRGMQALLDRALLGWIEDTEEPGAPGWPTFAAGAMAAFDDLCGLLGQGRDAVVVTSAGVVAAICGTLLSLVPEGIVAVNRVMVNAAITTVVVGGSGANLLSLNDHGHFAGERRMLLTYR